MQFFRQFTPCPPAENLLYAITPSRPLNAVYAATIFPVISACSVERFRVKFTDNTVRNNGAYGLTIDGQTKGTIIRSNIIEVVRPNGVGIRMGAKAGTVAIEDNKISATHPISDARRSDRKP